MTASSTNNSSAVALLLLGGPLLVAFSARAYAAAKQHPASTTPASPATAPSLPPVTDTDMHASEGQASEMGPMPSMPPSDLPATETSASKTPASETPASSPSPPVGTTSTDDTHVNLSSHPPLGRRLTMSTLDGANRVVQADAELLEQAHRVDSSVTLDELTAARLIASERGDAGSTIEWCCIVDAEVNRAQRAGKSLHDSLTRGAGFGEQGHLRPASTRLDPSEGHLAAARAVLSGEARGIARGAVRFYDPHDEDVLARRYEAWLAAPNTTKRVARTCDALTILERWSFGYPFSGVGCELNRTRIGADNEPQAWVGPIPGVDAWRLMLFVPMPASDPRHRAAYEAARDLLTRARRAA